MLAALRPAIAMVVLFTLLLGVAIPLGFTALAGAVFPDRAGGSLIRQDGRVVGSALLGQSFTSDRYFQGRPSATSEPDPDKEGSTRSRPYNGAASAASQMGPTSAALLETVNERLAGQRGVPADAAYASGSGLDPHVSPENALRQVPRVATARNLPEARVRDLVLANVEGRVLGLVGQPRVNVLLLNRALDGAR